MIPCHPHSPGYGGLKPRRVDAFFLIRFFSLIGNGVGYRAFLDRVNSIRKKFTESVLKELELSFSLDFISSHNHGRFYQIQYLSMCLVQILRIIVFLS